MAALLRVAACPYLVADEWDRVGQQRGGGPGCSGQPMPALAAVRCDPARGRALPTMEPHNGPNAGNARSLDQKANISSSLRRSGALPTRW